MTPCLRPYPFGAIRCILLEKGDCCMELLRQVMASPVGPLTIEGDKTAITALHFGDLGAAGTAPLLQEAQKQLEEYFHQQRRTFTLPLRFQGTPFQQRVWGALAEIPWGRTISYRQLAELAGSPKGFRAAGNANGKNPLPILLPCHRVIAADGSLGGYSGGLAIKSALLALEGHSF